MPIATRNSKFYIGTTAENPVGDTFTHISAVESVTKNDVTIETIQYTPLTEGETKYIKGNKSNGTVDVVILYDDGDTALAKMEDALNSDDEYNFKTELNNAATSGGTGSSITYKGLVIQKQEIGAEDGNEVAKRTYTIQITKSYAATEAA